MVHKVSPPPMQQQHITQQPKKYGEVSHGVSGVRTENNNDSRSGFDPPHFPLKFERLNFYPGNFSKLIL